jgi:hypothetical protein
VKGNAPSRGWGEGGVDQWHWWATQLESGRREGRGCREEDGVIEKFRNLHVARRWGRLTRGHDNEYTYTQYIRGNVHM